MGWNADGTCSNAGGGFNANRSSTPGGVFGTDDGHVRGDVSNRAPRRQGGGGGGGFSLDQVEQAERRDAAHIQQMQAMQQQQMQQQRQQQQMQMQRQQQMAQQQQAQQQQRQQQMMMQQRQQQAAPPSPPNEHDQIKARNQVRTCHRASLLPPRSLRCTACCACTFACCLVHARHRDHHVVRVVTLPTSVASHLCRRHSLGSPTSGTWGPPPSVVARRARGSRPRVVAASRIARRRDATAATRPRAASCAATQSTASALQAVNSLSNARACRAQALASVHQAGMARRPPLGAAAAPSWGAAPRASSLRRRCTCAPGRDRVCRIMTARQRAAASGPTSAPISVATSPSAEGDRVQGEQAAKHGAAACG